MTQATDTAFHLTGKTILVTGASSGIGREICVQIASMGGIVIATGRDRSRLDETLAMLGGGEHRGITADLTIAAERASIAAEIATGRALIEVASTALAARLAKDDPVAAAVASELAGRLYDLRVAQRKIEDERTNVTRFLVGAMGVGTAEGLFEGHASLIATGGTGALWGRTTNAPGATADGIVLAMRAGAQVSDLEFMQFHPTALDDGSPSQRILLTEALRGEGATLHNEAGGRFVDELAPRHVVTRAILEQASVTLDCRQIPDLEERFPTVIAGARARGFDPVTRPLPVSPDAYGRTSVDQLFAAGESAATGMHGANRMAGNSLLESVVVGRRVGQACGTADQGKEWFGYAPMSLGLASPETFDARIPEIMWNDVGPIRDGDRLLEATTALADLPQSGYTEICAMIARAAAARLESRGVHIRSDYPEQDSAFATRSFDQHHAHAR